MTMETGFLYSFSFLFFVYLPTAVLTWKTELRLFCGFIYLFTSIQTKYTPCKSACFVSTEMSSVYRFRYGYPVIPFCGHMETIRAGYSVDFQMNRNLSLLYWIVACLLSYSIYYTCYFYCRRTITQGLGESDQVLFVLVAYNPRFFLFVLRFEVYFHRKRK